MLSTDGTSSCNTQVSCTDRLRVTDGECRTSLRCPRTSLALFHLQDHFQQVLQKLMQFCLRHKVEEGRSADLVDVNSQLAQAPTVHISTSQKEISPFRQELQEALHDLRCSAVVAFGQLSDQVQVREKHIREFVRILPFRIIGQFGQPPQACNTVPQQGAAAVSMDKVSTEHKLDIAAFDGPAISHVRPKLDVGQTGPEAW